MDNRKLKIREVLIDFLLISIGIEKEIMDIGYGDNWLCEVLKLSLFIIPIDINFYIILPL